MQWSLLWKLQCGRLILWAEIKVSWQGEPTNPKPSNAHQPPPPATALCGLKPAIRYASASSGMRTLPWTLPTILFYSARAPDAAMWCRKQALLKLSRQFFILLLLLFTLLRNPASTLDLWSCCTFTTDISRNSSISRFCCDFLKGKRKQRKSFSSPGKYWQQGWTTQLCTCLQEKGANITDAKLSCKRKSAKLGLLPKSLRDSISLRLW